MMKIVAFVTCLILFVSTALSDAAAKKGASTPIQLIETGQFHGDEITAQTGEQWLGLYPAGSDCVLIPSTLTVEAVHDEIVDQDPEVKTGKRVSVDLYPDPIFLLKGAEMLQPGLVATVFEESKSLSNGDIVELKLFEKEYQLRVEGESSPTFDYITPDSKLLLTIGERTQVLYSLEGSGGINDPNWHLIWAGDLDGDAQLDLYMDLSFHYNISQRKLFLSTQARKGNLVKEAATFVTSGC